MFKTATILSYLRCLILSSGFLFLIVYKAKFPQNGQAQWVETNPSKIHFFPTDIHFYFASWYYANRLQMSVYGCSQMLDGLVFSQPSKPLPVCPWKKSLCRRAQSFDGSWRRYFADCWWSARDFTPATRTSPKLLIKYYYYIN